MKKILLILALLVFFSGCIPPTSEMIQTAIVQTAIVGNYEATQLAKSEQPKATLTPIRIQTPTINYGSSSDTKEVSDKKYIQDLGLTDDELFQYIQLNKRPNPNSFELQLKEFFYGLIFYSNNYDINTEVIHKYFDNIDIVYSNNIINVFINQEVKEDDYLKIVLDFMDGVFVVDFDKNNQFIHNIERINYCFKLPENDYRIIYFYKNDLYIIDKDIKNIVTHTNAIYLSEILSKNNISEDYFKNDNEIKAQEETIAKPISINSNSEVEGSIRSLLNNILVDSRYNPNEQVIHKYIEDLDIDISGNTLSFTVNTAPENKDEVDKLAQELLVAGIIAITNSGITEDGGISLIELFIPGPSGSSARFYVQGNDNILGIANQTINFYDVLGMDFKMGNFPN